jgi:hypothetical protein
VHDGKKALYYLIPLEQSFKISLTVREQEKAAFLSDKGLRQMHNQLSKAKKYPEGYALQFLIDDHTSFSELIIFIKKLTEIRK